MFYNVLKAKDLVNLDVKNMDKEILMERGDSCFKIFALKEGEMLDTHTALLDSAILVIDGQIEAHFEAEKFRLDKGEIIMFKKDKEHKVLALKDSKFFVISV